MEYSAPYEFPRVHLQYTLEKFFNAKDKKFVAWWPTYFRRNINFRWVPQVRVLFREIRNNHISQSVTPIDLPFDALDYVKIGTVWKNGICESKAVLESSEFDIDFNDSGWRLTSCKKEFVSGTEAPFPQFLHPLQFGNNDITPLLIFKLDNGGNLVIPCFEFFRKYFGSKELRRIFLTYSWREVQRRTSASLKGVRDSGNWIVSLPKNLINKDSIQVAYAKYSSYSNRVFKQIYSGLESGYDKQNRCFLEVVPWFQEKTRIKVRGHFFDNGRSFLALQILAGKDPYEGKLIEFFRPEQDKPENPAPDGSPESWQGAKPVVKFGSPETYKLNNKPPSQGSSRTLYIDEEEEILGAPRPIQKIVKKEALTSPSNNQNGDNPDGTSGGDREGTSGNGGKRSENTKFSYLSEGTLMDMWNSLINLQQIIGEENLSVECLSGENEYTSEKPKLMEFSPFTEEEISGKSDDPLELQEKKPLDAEVIKWPFLYPSESKLRGLMILKIVCYGKPFYLAEISRKKWESRVKDPNSADGMRIVPKEESFKGLVFMQEEDELFRTVEEMLVELRHDKGRFSKYLQRFPQPFAATFAHSKSSKQKIACAASIVNAFGKLGIDIKEPMSAFS